ncbi:MAG TPA: DUF5615 family PIN-like protein [Streptosporangiaceae bacterium]
MSLPLLLDEMFSDNIAQQLRGKGHDVASVAADASLLALPDDQILAQVAATGRTLVTANIKDFIPLEGRYRAAGRPHAGLILVSAKTFPQGRQFMADIKNALADLLDTTTALQAGQVLFLTRN